MGGGGSKYKVHPGRDDGAAGRARQLLAEDNVAVRSRRIFPSAAVWHCSSAPCGCACCALMMACCVLMTPAAARRSRWWS